MTEQEAQLRRSVEGSNQLPTKKVVPDCIKFLREITNVFSNLLWGAAILSFIGFGLSPDDKSNLWLGVVIVLIILISGSFSFYQNKKSEMIMETFRSFTISQVTVIRNGNISKIPGINLVRGDVVKITAGEKIQADMRIFTSNDLQIDNSPLTGESIPIKLSSNCGEKGLSNPLEAKNIAFFSTLCKNGSGTGVVIQTGANTFMGKIADLAFSAETNETTLQKEINHCIKVIAISSVTIGIIFFILGFIIKYPVITNFIFAIGIVVANVPEGLYTTVTITLTITARKMLEKKVMVKNLQSVETLGSITAICSDKTGTLTQNKMSVVHLWYDCEIKKTKIDQQEISIDGHTMKMQIFDANDETFSYLKFAAVCGSKGNFIQETPEDYIPVIQERNKFLDLHPKAPYEEILAEVARLKKRFQAEYKFDYEKNIDERITDSDASETGILKFFEKIEKIETIRKRFPQHIDIKTNKPVIIPFNSTLKFTCFLRKFYDEDGLTIFQLAIKGAPERIIERCNRYLMNGQERAINEEFRNSFEEANKCFALKGERVIGLAFTRLDSNIFNETSKFYNHPMEEFNPDYKYEIPEPNYPIENLCFVGLIAMEDPPRPGVKESISLCHRAGIKVIMVTGDQPLTAASIAYQIGIIKDLDDIPEIIKERENLKSIEEAEKRSNTIIITGDRLSKFMKEDEMLSEENPRKGALLREWLMKRDVVFARTSPEQKLVIVDGCQKLSHLVAVTGDGVNDSPAIKKADIGIAMGKVGTDVAKDAADILLLDDNFANIIRGIKRGRTIFDTLKKILGYNLTSNVTELLPFLGFVILQFPLPFTTIMVLIIDCFTNVYPDISFSYEPSEANIMDRKPRNHLKDKLANLRLFGYAYLFTGVIQCSAGFLAYFAAFNDYGFPPNSLFFIVQREGIIPNRGDIFNPYDTLNGNSNAFLIRFSELLGIYGEAKSIFVDTWKRRLDFTSDSDLWVDYRLFQPGLDEYSQCRFHSRGAIYDRPVCYHMIDAMRHAQSAFLLAVIIMQVANGIIFRTISTSIFKHKFSNWPLNLAYVVQIALIICILYIPGLNTGLQLRALRFEHWIPCLGTWLTFIFFSELTKFLIRRVKNPDGSPGFFHQYFYY